MNNLLKIGDVIEIKAGMEIYAEIPEKFRFSNRPLSSKLTTAELLVGQVLTNNCRNWEKNEKEVIMRTKETFKKILGVAPEEEIETFVSQHFPKTVQETFDTSDYIGEYVVTSTLSDFHSHQVICKKLNQSLFDPNGCNIFFYQRSDFTNKMEEIQPIRKMELLFV